MSGAAAELLVAGARAALEALIEGVEEGSDRERARRALAELDAQPRPRPGQRRRLVAIALGLDPDAPPATIEEAGRIAVSASGSSPALIEDVLRLEALTQPDGPLSPDQQASLRRLLVDQLARVSPPQTPDP